MVLGITIPLIIFKNKIGKEKISLIIKIFAVSFFALSIFRNFFNDGFMLIINGGETGGVYYETSDVFQSILRWGMAFVCVVYVCAAFYNKRTMRWKQCATCRPVFHNKV